MRENSMTRFDESIFRPLLKQMDFGTGYIDATKSKYFKFKNSTEKIVIYISSIFIFI